MFWHKEEKKKVSVVKVIVIVAAVSAAVAAVVTALIIWKKKIFDKMQIDRQIEDAINQKFAEEAIEEAEAEA